MLEELLRELEEGEDAHLLDEVPDLNAQPDALTGGFELLDDNSEYETMWDSYYPNDVPFFKLSLMDKLRRSSYHMTTLKGNFEMQRLMKAYQDKIYRSETTLTKIGKLQVRRLMLALGNGAFAYFAGGEFMVYAPTPKLASDTARELEQYVTEPVPSAPRFHIVSLTNSGPEWTSIRMGRVMNLSPEDRALHYGEDFLTWEEAWLKQLQSRASGLTILHGPPGCGKTSYLRGLLTQLVNQYKLCYVPVSQAEILSDARYVGFWLESRGDNDRKKIVILEDAEELLLPRDSGSRDKVSTLLNVADGFIGDFLKVQVIATTNAPVGNLDPAIMRPGRLMGLREFRRLTRSEAERLAQAKHLSLPDQRDYSLAEIYCPSPSATGSDNQPRKFGFA